MYCAFLTLRFSPLATRTILSTFFFFNDTATTEIYTLSLHDALPIFSPAKLLSCDRSRDDRNALLVLRVSRARSEEHTSELQSHLNLVCRLLLEKKKNYLDTTHLHNNT